MADQVLGPLDRAAEKLLKPIRESLDGGWLEERRPIGPSEAVDPAIVVHENGNVLPGSAQEDALIGYLQPCSVPQARRGHFGEGNGREGVAAQLLTSGRIPDGLIKRIPLMLDGGGDAGIHFGHQGVEPGRILDRDPDPAGVYKQPDEAGEARIRPSDQRRRNQQIAGS